MTKVSEPTISVSVESGSASGATGDGPLTVIDRAVPESAFEISFIEYLTSVSTAVVTTRTPHNFTTGDNVEIAGIDEAAYNGTFEVVIVNATQFYYALATQTVLFVGGTNAYAALVESIELNYFDNTYWDAQGFILWDAGPPERWLYNFFNGGQARILATGLGPNAFWYVGFRPSAVRVRMNRGSTPAGADMTVYVGDANYSVAGGGPPSSIIGSQLFEFSGAGNPNPIEHTIPLDFSTAGDIRVLDPLYPGGSSDDGWYIEEIVFLT